MGLITSNWSVAHRPSSSKGSSRHSSSDNRKPPEVARFLSSNQTFSVEEGKEIAFPCIVDRKDEEYKMIFKFVPPSGDDRIIYAEDIKVTHFPRIQKIGASFVLKDVHKSDAGMYICRFETNPVMQLVHRLQVQYPAEVDRIGSKLRKVRRGSTVTLECEARGNPPPVITWSKDKGTLSSGAFFVEGKTITLKHVNLSEEGTYVCKASNGIGAPASTHITLLVEYPPEVISTQSLVFGRHGVDAQILCIVHGRPLPEVKWLRNNSPVWSEKHVMTHDGSHRHTLTIKQVSEEDFGNYNCSASNKHGKQWSSSFVVGLPKKPIVISNPGAQHNTSYNLIFETESLAAIIQYYLRYRKAPLDLNDKDDIPWTVNLYHPLIPPVRGSGNDHSRGGLFTINHTIENLDPAEDYEVMVRVESRHGWSPFSDVFRFYTKKNITIGESTSGGENENMFSFSYLGLSAILILCKLLMLDL